MEKLLEKLKTEKMLVCFVKKDGTTRTMLCTQNQEYTGVITYSQNTGPEHLICVWDLEKEDWRSFRKDSVLSYVEV